MNSRTAGPLGIPSHSRIQMAQLGLNEAQQNYILERLKNLSQTNSMTVLSLVANVSQEVKERWGTRINTELVEVRFLACTSFSM